MTTVRAELPAIVWQVRISVGDEVVVDEELLVLESMKMEIPVSAPIAGTIAALHVGVGDSLAEGDALVEII